MTSVDERFVKSCISYLDCLNTNAFNRFKTQIKRSGVQLSLIDIFVQIQQDLENTMKQKEPGFFKRATLLETDRNQLKDPILKYLKSHLNHTPFGAWGHLPASDNPTIGCITEALISIEQLASTELKGGYDQLKIITAILNQMNQQIDQLQDSGDFTAIKRLISQMEKEVKDRAPVKLLLLVGAARDALLKKSARDIKGSSRNQS